MNIEIISARDAPLGGPRGMTVHRTLPHRKRSTIGAWCFVDHYGPDDVSITGGMDVAPHPHTGLQTVSWLFEGTITHHDSGDNHAVVRPGEVNLMTAGGGICHSEVSTTDTTALHGVQLWTVLPEGARTGPRRFDHYAPPVLDLGVGSALVFLGSLFGHTAPVSTFTPLLGAEIRLNPHSQLSIELNPEFEHGILLDTGSLRIADTPIAEAEIGYFGIGETRVTIHNDGPSPARMLLIGGEPFTEDFIMWWSFIGRSNEEIIRFREAWETHSDQFGRVDGYIARHPDALTRLPAPQLPQVNLRPRRPTTPMARP